MTTPDTVPIATVTLIFSMAQNGDIHYKVDSNTSRRIFSDPAAVIRMENAVVKAGQGISEIINDIVCDKIAEMQLADMMGDVE